MVHFMHNLSAKVLENREPITSTIHLFSKIFKNSTKKRKIFKNHTNLNVEKTPIAIRFGTYFNYFIYL